MQNHSSLHDGHRNRMKERFLNSGLYSFSEHEILEMLLFYAIPRKNTNNLAHVLINNFGSLMRVFNTNIKLLENIAGMSESSAILIKIIPSIVKSYAIDFDSLAINVRDVDNFKRMLLQMFLVETRKGLIKLLYLDFNYNIVGCDDIFVSHNSYNVPKIHEDVKYIVQRADMYHSLHVIIAYKNQQNPIDPSDNEEKCMKKTRELLKELNIDLVDNMIVSDTSVYSFYLKSCI